MEIIIISENYISTWLNFYFTQVFSSNFPYFFFFFDSETSGPVQFTVDRLHFTVCRPPSMMNCREKKKGLGPVDVGFFFVYRQRWFFEETQSSIRLFIVNTKKERKEKFEIKMVEVLGNRKNFSTMW